MQKDEELLYLKELMKQKDDKIKELQEEL